MSMQSNTPRKFTLTVLDASGCMRPLELAATDADAAVICAEAQGFKVVSSEEVLLDESAPSRSRIHDWLNQRDSIDSVAFSQDLATLLNAGVSVKDAIATLQKKENSAQRAAILASVQSSISQGMTLSAALGKTGVFPELLIATIAASEETGDMGLGLARYAKHQQSIQAVRDKVIGAFVYPLLLLTVGSIVIALLLGLVVPRFATLIDSTGKALPFFSQILMDWGRLVGRHNWLAPLFFGSFIALVVWVIANVANPVRRKKVLSVLPGLAKVAREFQHLQLYRTTAILTSRGIVIHKALGYGFEFLDEEDQLRLKNALESMREGKSPSLSLHESGLCDVVAFSMLHVAEQSGSMPEMLDRVADFYERTLQRNIDLVSRLIEPLLMVVFGAVIGAIVILMYLPIFDLAASIS